MASLGHYTNKFGNKNPLIDGYKFVLDRRNKCTINWKCSDAKTIKCPAKGTTDQEISTIIKGQYSHNHPLPSDDDIRKMELQHKCKKRALANPDLKTFQFCL